MDCDIFIKIPILAQYYSIKFWGKQEKFRPFLNFPDPTYKTNYVLFLNKVAGSRTKSWKGKD